MRIIPIGARIRYSYLVLTKNKVRLDTFSVSGIFCAELRFFPKIIKCHGLSFTNIIIAGISSIPARFTISHFKGIPNQIGNFSSFSPAKLKEIRSKILVPLI